MAVFLLNKFILPFPPLDMHPSPFLSILVWNKVRELAKEEAQAFQGWTQIRGPEDGCV